MADGRGGMIQIAGVGVGNQPVPLTEVAIHLHLDDDVAVATRELAPRQLIAGPFESLKVARLVPVGHKVALRAIPLGGAVHRYGQIIGFATAPIAPGDHVHSHNLGVHDFARDYAAGRGLIIADTKFEFGRLDGQIILIDEALTPDSSRFWEASQYQPGRAQASFDKQFVRDYLGTLGWDKTAPGPSLPTEIVEKTAAKYREAYQRLTGEELA